MTSLTPNVKGTPPGGAPRLSRFLVFAGTFLFALFTAAPHGAQKESAASREPKIWIEASHSFVCPDDGSARLPLRVRGVSEGCRPRYSWTVNGGAIEGVGAEIVWNLSGVRPRPDKYYDAIVTVNTGPACGSRKASAIWRACVVCPPHFVTPPPTQPPPRFCPAISFDARATAAAGQNVPVIATLSGAAPGVTPKYKWTVLQGGRINGGQGTNSILVGAGNAGQTILAKVEVRVYRSGPSCSATASIPVVPAPTPTPLTLKVSVRNARDGRPVPHAKTTFYLGGRPVLEDAATDEGGGFSRAGWTPGIYRVVVSADRFERQESTVTLDHFSTGSVVLSLKPAIPPTPTPSPSPTISPTPSPTSSPTPSPTPSSTPTPAPAPEESGTAETDSRPVTVIQGRGLLWIPVVVILLAALAAAASTFLKRDPSAVPPPSGDDGAPPAAAKEAGDEVHCTVFAPEQAAPGDPIIVQVFAHLEEQAGELAGIAAKSGDELRDRGSKQLDQRVERDTKLSFRLDMPGLNVYEPEQSLVWRGKVDSVFFAVDVPEDFKPKNARGIVKIYYDGAPVGQIMFILKVAAAGAAQAPAAQTPAPPPQEVIMYKRAFVSYSSDDRLEVLERMQGLERGLKKAGITCFMDKKDIQPGQPWNERLRKEIDSCDQFYLFWSSNAMKSDGVKEEIEYALARKGADDSRPPFFEPFTIELPLPKPLPKGLESLHFVEPILYEIKAEEAIKDETAARQT